MDDDRADRMQRALADKLGPESKQQIMQILGQIDSLNGTEKLFLYLKLPTGPPPPDPLKQPVNPLGSRSEIQQTVMWIQTHLEVDPDVSLPKKDVYDEYSAYCTDTKMKPLSTADFGKVMKQVYPTVKPRRLGTRGNSRYCYAGMRKKIKLEVPQLPDLGEKSIGFDTPVIHNDAISKLIKEWAEKHLGLNFGNLSELAHHLLEQKLVENTSDAAQILLNSTSESSDCYDFANSKNSDLSPKIQQRGVIRQLKRKIQTQSPIPVKPVLKKSKSEDEVPEEIDNLSESHQIPSNLLLGQDFPVKIETEPIVSDCISEPHLIPKNRDYIVPNIVDSSTDLTPPALRNLPPDFRKDYSQNVAVNLTQSSFSRTRYSPQFSAGGPKSTVSVSHPCPRQLNYTDSYKYSSMYVSHNQAAFIGLNNVANCDMAMTHSQNVSNHNLPINLSNNHMDVGGNLTKPYKPPICNNFELQPPASCESDSLNLSVHRRDNWFPPETASTAPPVKLPLPGKKMFLEVYQNQSNQNLSSIANFNEQTPKPISQSPDRGQYLPKKMRATENFGGKLSSSRLVGTPQLDVQQIEPEKYNKIETEDFSPSSVKFLQNPVPNSNLNSYPVVNKPICDVKPLEYSNSSNPAIFMQQQQQQQQQEEPEKLQKSLYSPKKGQKNCKYNKKPANTKSPDSTNSVGKNATGPENVPLKTVTRGRPRKKSLTKAKYTRKQPRQGQANQCDHTKHPKRSSDSCCSLTETINIKTGIICVENHSEILNRERVSSICNMDKHALDDYLNEGNSQEHEEELMKYFQPNGEGTLSVDSNNKKIHDDEMKSLGVVSSTETIKKHNIPSTSGVITSNTINASLQNTSLDTSEDHSQGKSEKISQLREILQKNLKHNLNNTIQSHGMSDGDSSVCGFPHPNASSESAFATITRRKVVDPQESFEFKEGSASASLNLLSKKQQNNAKNNLSPITIRRRGSFENPTCDSNEQHSQHGNQNSPIHNKGQHSVPQSPTSRVQHFNFMPISPGRLSPISSNKNSPTITSYKHTGSPLKGNSTVTCTSPVSFSSSASPFVSPRNTPVPRARTSCHEKPIPNKFQSRKLSKLGIPKGLYLGDKMHMSNNNHHQMNKNMNELGNFIMPNEQSPVPRSPNFMTKPRTFPMSAPPSPNILTSKYKPSFPVHSQNSPSLHIVPNVIQDMPLSAPPYSNHDTMNMRSLDSAHNEHSQPLSADPLSREISQFFAGNNLSMDESNNSLRSQSVPLNQNIYFNQNQSNNSGMSNMNYLSYNNTPCNSVPPTPIPNEFCDFGSLNDTCDSITKVALDENLDKIYNILDSNTQENLIMDNVVKQNEMLLNHVNADNLGMPSFPQDITNGGNMSDPLLTELEPILAENNKTMPKMHFGTQLPHTYMARHNFTSESLKRSNSAEMNLSDAPNDNRFYISRSVPSTPLPGTKNILPNFNLSKTHLDSHGQFRDEYADETCTKFLISKSVPSTPQLTDERNMFSYSNRDFLINGNSVDPSVSNAFNDKTSQNDQSQLEQSFLGDTGTLIEDKTTSSVLASFTSSPLPEAIDIVNNELTPFNDCIDIDTENDLLNIL